MFNHSLRSTIFQLYIFPEHFSWILILHVFSSLFFSMDRFQWMDISMVFNELWYKLLKYFKLNGIEWKWYSYIKYIHWLDREPYILYDDKYHWNAVHECCCTKYRPSGYQMVAIFRRNYSPKTKKKHTPFQAIIINSANVIMNNVNVVFFFYVQLSSRNSIQSLQNFVYCILYTHNSYIRIPVECQ